MNTIPDESLARGRRRWRPGQGTVLAGLALVGLVVAGLVLPALFEEPSARDFPSLVELTGSSTLLAVFAHPEDEILVAATLADAARRGCRVYSVTATRGEQGVPDGFVGARSRLIRLRDRELREFGAAIGTREQMVWDFPDGRLEEVELEVLVDSVWSVIRRHEPDLVVTFDSSAGFTGHPDHRRAAAFSPGLDPSPSRSDVRPGALCPDQPELRLTAALPML